MKITKCKINHLTNPMGFTLHQVTASWVAESEKSAAQKSARICVAKDPCMKEIIYDTGEQAELDSLATVLPLPLSARTRYYWTVEVWGEGGDYGISDINWFETGKMEESWQAKWITTPWEDKDLHPYLRGSICIPQEIDSARIYATGLGVYELEVNGQRVSEERLAPGCTAYDYWVQVQTYDVTELLRRGENGIGAMLGNGWAKGPFGNFPQIESPRTDEFSLLLELRVTLKDGSKMVFGTGEDWLCAPSPVLEDSIYDGEVYDARKEIRGWSEGCLAAESSCDGEGSGDRKTDCSGDIWEPVKLWENKKNFPLVDRLSPVVRICETVEPVELIHTPADEWVLDLGQNIAGWLRFRVREAVGTRIKLSYGEVLQNDCFYNENLCTAKAEYHYICDGAEHVVEPHFTFYGFRYVKLEGFSQPISLDDFTGCVVYSDLEETGWIETSDPMVNRLFENTKWSQKDNFLDVPTDCPQRDERMGWTGDAQVFCRTASYHMDTYAFYRKYLKDLWLEQQQMDGMVGCVVPSFATEMPKTSGFSTGGSAAWGDCATIMPWTIYLQYGDPAILKEQYPSMKAWVDWIRRQCGESLLWNTGFHYGDWLALDGPVPGGTQGGTEITYVASAYYRYSTDIVAKAAEVLGYAEDACHYRKLSEAIRDAMQAEYFSPNGRLAIQTQTAYAVALQFDIAREYQKPRIMEDFVRQCRKDGMHLQTGFVGTAFLCHALTSGGRVREAYDIFFQTDYPSWLYEVSMGATTVWERWNSILPDGSISSTGMNSLNHYSYGAIAEWMYRGMCGIEPIEPGFKRFALQPKPDERLRCVRASFASPMGTIAVAWEIGEDDYVTLKVKVPFNTTAELILAGAYHLTGDVSLSQKGSDLCGTLTAGEYTFRYQTAIRVEYSFKQSLNELDCVPAVREYLQQRVPVLYDLPAGMEPNSKIPFEEALLVMSSNVRKRLEAAVDLKELEEGLRKIPVAVRDNGFRWYS